MINGGGLFSAIFFQDISIIFLRAFAELIIVLAKYPFKTHLQCQLEFSLLLLFGKISIALRLSRERKIIRLSIFKMKIMVLRTR